MQRVLTQRCISVIDNIRKACVMSVLAGFKQPLGSHISFVCVHCSVGDELGDRLALAQPLSPLDSAGAQRLRRFMHVHGASVANMLSACCWKSEVYPM